MAFDNSEYRQDTYGPPDYYCDCTRSLASNGTGTLGDPWNVNQAIANAVAGDVVGFLPVADGAQADPVDIATTGDNNIPAFNPTNSGTGTANSQRIIFVTKYAAVKLYKDSPSTIASNTNRTELRHDGVAPTIVGGVGAGDGCAMYGSYGKNYITYDGFFVDMSQAYCAEDTGVIRAENSTGITFKNFVIKGTTLTLASNAIIYRPENALDTVLSNFVAYDFTNDPTGSNTPQQAVFSAQYGDQNFLIEHFEIDDVDNGIFPKGSAASNTVFNYGRIQYGIVKNCGKPFGFNALDGTNRTYLQYCLAYNTIGSSPYKAWSPDGIVFDSIAPQGQNITIDHCTIAKVDSTDANLNGAFVVEDNGLESGVIVTNNIFDMDNGSFGYVISLLDSVPDTLDYNFYYKNGALETYHYNSTAYNDPSTAFADWQTATGRDANSIEGTSSPFNDRANDDYTIDTEHVAYTASSTGGQLGAYATSETLGVETVAAGTIALFLG